MNWDLAQYLKEGEKDSEFGRFVIEPLPSGMASIVGNALRRQILSAVPGAAVKGIAIEGVVHEFTTYPGLYEDIPDFVLNLRDVVFKLTGVTEEVVRLESGGERDIYAKDLILPLGVEVLNPDHYICHLDDTTRMNVEIFVGTGRGFVPEEENKDEEKPINTIFVNSNFSPVKIVTFRTEPFEKILRNERLILDIKTNGSVSPVRALKIGAVYLDKVLGIMKEFEEFDEDSVVEDELTMEQPDTKSILEMPVSELGLSRRSSNCLKSGDITTIGQLVELSKNQLMKLKNFGKKSLDEIREKLSEHNLSLKDEGEDTDAEQEEQDET